MEKQEEIIESHKTLNPHEKLFSNNYLNLNKRFKTTTKKIDSPDYLTIHSVLNHYTSRLLKNNDTFYLPEETLIHYSDPLFLQNINGKHIH